MSSNSSMKSRDVPPGNRLAVSVKQNHVPQIVCEFESNQKCLLLNAFFKQIDGRHSARDQRYTI